MLRGLEWSLENLVYHGRYFFVANLVSIFLLYITPLLLTSLFLGELGIFTAGLAILWFVYVVMKGASYTQRDHVLHVRDLFKGYKHIVPFIQDNLVIAFTAIIAYQLDLYFYIDGDILFIPFILCLVYILFMIYVFLYRRFYISSSLKVYEYSSLYTYGIKMSLLLALPMSIFSFAFVMILPIPLLPRIHDYLQVFLVSLIYIVVSFIFFYLLSIFIMMSAYIYKFIYDNRLKQDNI
jgi:hypothetical protein